MTMADLERTSSKRDARDCQERGTLARPIRPSQWLLPSDDASRLNITHEEAAEAAAEIPELSDTALAVLLYVAANPTATQVEIGAAVGITDRHVRNVQRSPPYVAVAERLAAQAQRRALAMLRQGMEPAARKLLRIINSPFADQTTVAAIRTLFDVTNAKRLEGSSAEGEPLVPEMTDAERVTAIEALLTRAKARRESETRAVPR
jgi:hypothetical protein